MTAERALRKALVQIRAEDAAWKAIDTGIFLIRAPSPAVLPYTTYAITSAVPERTMRTTSGWVFKVQIKHWAQEKAGLTGMDLVQSLKDRSGALLHARDTQDYGRTAAEVMAQLNALSGLNGWTFINAEIVGMIPPYLDAIGEAEVWCGGHMFEFWLEYAS